MVWDGDQILYEIQALGGTLATTAAMEADVGLAAAVPVFSYDSRTIYEDPTLAPPSDSTVTPANGADGFYYGRVLYTHGGGIDAPLSVTRMEYSDSLSAPMTVFLHRDWRGTHDLGTYEGGGTQAPCKTITVTKHLQEPAEGQEPGGGSSGGSGASEHCWEIDWPAPHVEITGRTYERSLVGAVGWSGSQIDAMRDASGLMYRRNRYYDPSSGRCTQEDPIGIAGGLNVYGFAAGDPVSYSDPYGLCAQGDTLWDPGVGYPDFCDPRHPPPGHDAIEEPAWYQDGVAWGIAVVGAVGNIAKGPARGLLSRLLRRGAGTIAGKVLLPTVQRTAGRSGGRMLTMIVPRNSYIRGGGSRVFESDAAGRIIRDITPTRVKVRSRNVAPDGRVFEHFQKVGAPSRQDLEILRRMGVTQ